VNSLFLALQPPLAFDDWVPAEHERDHQTVHAEVLGRARFFGPLLAKAPISVKAVA
jgi:hypothetical protein